jgi:hypothetical protein
MRSASIGNYVRLFGLLFLAASCSGGGSGAPSSPTQPTTPTTPATPPPATQLAFTTEPTAAMTATPLAPAVAVTARTAAGATATNFTGTITLALGANPGSSVLGGTTTATAVAGVATFSNLTLDKAGVGYTLVASATGLTPATSGAFTITAPVVAGTRLYISPIFDFRLRTTPTVVTGASTEWCLSTTDWSATLAGDMVGTAYTINLAVKTSNQSSGSGTLGADIILRRGTAETVLATTTFTTTSTYTVRTYTATGIDPTSTAGDRLILRVRIVTPSAGLPCLAEFVGPGTDNYIIVPTTTIAP